MIDLNEIKKAQFIEDFRRAELLGREDEFLKSFGIDIEKGGKKANVGEIREHSGKRFKKVAEGKWVEVSEHGMTKVEHDVKSRMMNYSSNPTVTNNAKMNKEYHKTKASKLSDKEHSDEEVGLGKKKESKNSGKHPELVREEKRQKEQARLDKIYGNNH